MKNNIKIHFIGISGIGMSGIAELMQDKGYKIQGSDISFNENSERLQKKGIKFFLGHSKKNISSVDAVIYSSAIKKNNPEIKEAINKKIPLLSRADMLAELMKNKKSIAIAGSHGKTTTTSLVGNILDQAKLDATAQQKFKEAYFPLELAGAYGSGITPLISGYPGGSTVQTSPSPTPLQTGISAGATLAGLYRAFN